jgi:hypothetical protein
MHDDDALLAELKAALDAARHPRQEKLTADARDAFSFLAVSDEFAALVFDSLWEDALETTSRAATTIRSLAFESADLSLEVEISADAVVGQLSPAAVTRIVAEWGDGTRRDTESDEFGTFRLVPGGSGPVRFRIGPAAAAVVTDWVNAAG